MDLDPAAPQPVIARLPEILVNQIAAGEVVERPASAIKELVENSLDAGSTRIEVLLKNGGIEEITIVDNGSGMIAADLLLCIERHATSKIRCLEELEAVTSYGFRGEALSSIASVSRLEIISRVPSADRAHTVAVDFGVAGELRPAGAPVGTRVTVRDLFARLPVRQKFLRTPGTELAASARTVRELALGSPGVDFFLHHQGRRVAEYVGPTRESRFREAFKASWLTRQPLRGQETTEGATLEFFLSPPEWQQDRGELLLYLNDRIIRNRNLLAAVRNAYLTTLGAHHEPSGVVYLDLRPEWVDVNVHPQKLEVRCLRQETLYPWILSTVRKALHGARVTAGPLAPPMSPIVLPAPEQARARASPPTAAPGGEAGARLNATPARGFACAEPAREYLVPPDAVAEAEPWALPPAPRFLGIAGGRFLVAEDRRGLIVIDTRAAATRRLHARWQRAFAVGGLPAQPLLMSQVIRLPLDLHGVFEDNAESLKRFGFEAEPFGDGDVSLKSLPADLDAARAEDGLRAVLRALAVRADDTAVLNALAAAVPPAALSPAEALALFAEDETTGYRMDFAALGRADAE